LPLYGLVAQFSPTAGLQLSGLVSPTVVFKVISHIGKFGRAGNYVILCDVYFVRVFSVCLVPCHFCSPYVMLVLSS
jgi:hypothetical protein